jgi:hypothetical protein
VKALAREIAISAQLRDVGLKFEMLVADRERGYRDGGAPSDTKRHALLDYAWSGNPGVDAVVTALVLAASRRSVSAPSHDRTDPSATRSVRACGEKEGSADTRHESCFRCGDGFVVAL